MSRKCPWSIFWLDSVAGACNEVEDLPVRLNNNGNDRLPVSRRFHQDWHPATSILWCFLSWDCDELFDGRIQKGGSRWFHFQSHRGVPNEQRTFHQDWSCCIELNTRVAISSLWQEEESCVINVMSGAVGLPIIPVSILVDPYIASECMRLWDSLPRKRAFTKVTHSSGQLCYSLSHCWWNGMARGVILGGNSPMQRSFQQDHCCCSEQAIARGKSIFHRPQTI